jgi:5-oxoprolinase (ATP-hydrolysing) subunit A
VSRAVDLNADLGEGYGVWHLGADEDLLPLLSSANVACGWHGGDPRIMDATVTAAHRAGVAVGAHPSFPDRAGFGRRAMDVGPADAEADLVYQIAALDGFCRRHGLRLQHVKAHGALYNQAAKDAALAGAVAAAVASLDTDLILVVPPGSAQETAGRQAGLTVAREGFCDRAYEPDGSLVDRRRPGAVHDEVETAVEQALSLATEGRVRCIDGTYRDLAVDTLCCHGDNPRAVEFVRRIRAELERAGVEIREMGRTLGRP